MIRKFRCTVQYEGTAFAGFQRQPGLVTVQGALESAIARVTRNDAVVVGAGRTDAGVHALGQVIHFTTGVLASGGNVASGLECLFAAQRLLNGPSGGS